MSIHHRLPSLVLLAAVAGSLLGCPPPPTTELETTPVGVIVGEVFIEDPELVSVGDATVQLLGSSYALTTEADRKFAIPAVPVGEHVLMIEHAPSGRAARVPVTVSQAFQTVELDEDLTTLQRAATVTGQVDLPMGVSDPVVVFYVGGTSDQIRLVGDGGTFELGPLPVGDARIAVSTRGYAPTIVDVTLEEGENVIEGPFALTASTDGGTVSGVARMIDRASHDAIVVKLNNGEYLTTTDAEGNYSIADVPPGHYELRAEQSGYAPAILGQVAVLDGGDVEGSADLWLSPGQPAAGAVGPGGGSAVNATILSSRNTDDGLEEDVPVSFSVNASHANGAPVESVLWSVTQDGVASDPVCGAQGCEQATLSIAGLEVGTYTVSVQVQAGDDTGSASFPLDVIPTRIAVEINVPGPNFLVEPGDPINLEATVTVRSGATVTTTWYDAACDEVGNIVATGATDTFPAPADQSALTLSVVSVAGTGMACDDRAVLIAPPVEVDFDVTALAGATIAGADWDPTLLGMGLLYLEIEEGHPLDLVADVDAGFTVVWSTDTGLNSAGQRFNLAALGLSDADGTTVTMTATGPEDQVVTRDAQIVVSPLTFEIALVSPVAGTTYLAESGLPLIATVNHGWQTSFPTVRWEDDNGVAIADVLSTTVTRPPGLGNVSITVTDVAGNDEQATVNTSVAALGFAVALDSPLDGAVFEVTDSVTARASVAHALVASGDKGEGDFVTTLAVDNVSQGTFAWDTDVDLGTFGPGVHTVKVIVQEQAPLRSRSDEVSFTVNAPAVVSLTRTSPLVDDLDFTTFQPPPALTYVVGGPAVAYRWYLDGVEFDASWFGYGADPTSAARASLTLPAYDPGAAPWTDPRWSDGEHLVEFCSTTDAGVPRQVCDAMTVTVYTTSSTSSTNIMAGEVETWSGAVLVTSTRYVYGTLIIAPGTKVFFDNAGGFVADGGTILIGQLGAARVEVVGLNATPGQRAAIGTVGCLYPSQLATVVVESATFEGCENAVTGNAQYIDPAATYELRDVIFRHGQFAVVGMCPLMEDVVFEDFADGIAETIYPGYGQCEDGRVYDGITFDGVDQTAIGVSPANGAVTMRNLTIRNAGVAFGFEGTGDLGFQDGAVVIEDNTVESSGIGVRTYHAERSPILVQRNTFSDLDLAFELSGSASGFDDDGDVTLVANRVDDVGAVFELRYARDGDVVARGNTFVDYGSLFDLAFPSGPLYRWREHRLQGNYLGQFDDPLQAAFDQVTGEVGRALPSSFTDDNWDSNNTNRIVRLDNPLEAPFLASAPPLAVVSAPDQSYRYHKDFCVPLQATAIVDGFDAGAGCSFELLDATDPDGGPRTALTGDADGCVSDADALTDGQNWLEMTCTDGLRTSTHRVRFYAARDRMSAPIHRAVATLDSDVTLTSDLVVPFGRSLTVSPGVEILVSGTDERRSRRTEVPSSDDLSDRLLVDLDVRGSLHLAGTAGDPVVVRPADGLAGPGTWGDVVAEGPTASLIYDHTTVEGARTVLTGVSDSAVARPTLEARFLEVIDAVHVGHRLCPDVFDDVTVTGAEGILRQGRTSTVDAAVCSGPLTIRRLTATGLTGDALRVEAHQDEPPSSIVLEDSTISFGSDRQHKAVQVSDGMTVLIDNVAADRFDQLVFVRDDGNGVGLVTIRDSDLSDFWDLYDEVNNFWGMDVVIEHNTITGGERVVRNGDGATTVTDNLITDVELPLHMKMTRPTSMFSVSGNSISGADVLATAESTQLGTATVTGNNFFSATTAVAANSGVNADLDFTGNHWGVATEPEVEALINDTRTDADPGDDIVGQTDYAGWSATPLSLPNLP